MRKITVLIAEDHLMVREGFRNLLNGERDIEIVGEAASGRRAVELAMNLRPSVVLMDLAMPGLNGLEAARQILKAMPKTKVIMLSAYGDDAYVEQAHAAGASGFLIKQASSDALCNAIRQVHNGGTLFDAPLAVRFRRRHGSKSERSEKMQTAELSSRECEVLQLIAEGKTNKETASELHISIKTVEKHRQSLMDKLRIHDTARLTRYAIANGIIEGNVQMTIA